MKNPDQQRAQVEQLLRRQRLHDAIERLRILAPAGRWDITSKLDRAEQDYRLMLQYAFTTAGADPERTRLHADITRRLHTVLLTIVRADMEAESPSLYFSTLRYERTRPADSISALTARYRKGMAGASLFARSTGSSTEGALSPSEREALERRLFNRVWTTFPLTGADAEAIGSLMTDATVPDRLPAMLTGALLLGSLNYPDDTALLLLLDAALHGSSLRLQLRAATAALLLLGCRRESMLPKPVADRLASLAETPGWQATVQQVWQQFIQSKLTERIDGKFRDEVLPAMMKLKEKIPDDLNMMDPEALAEINPEWEEIFEQGGLNKKLAELSELQNEGADLNHSTFGMLKSYPFFSEAANWFAPFDPEHSSVAEAAVGTHTLGDMLGNAPFLCDSDKYSLVFSLKHVPGKQREAISHQMNAHSDTLSRMAAEELLPEAEKRKNLVNRYIQDLYRFFRHFRRKEEFANPFGAMLDLSALISADNADTLRAVAELCFKHEYYAEALTLFDRIAANPASEADATLMQKRGYALQQLGRLREALAAFEKAELVQSDSVYTLRRIAALHRRLGHPAAALEYFQRIQALKPDDVAAVLSEGHCRLDMGMHREALHCYYRAEFMDEKSIRPVRPIAWVTLLMKDFDTSRKYYARLMAETTPDATDYLNMGHLNMAGGDPREALNFYRLYASGKSGDELRDAFEADRPMLAEAGVDTSVIPLIIDSILYA